MNPSLVLDVILTVRLYSICCPQPGETITVAQICIPVMCMCKTSVPVATASVFFHWTKNKFMTRVVFFKVSLHCYSHYCFITWIISGGSLSVVMWIPYHICLLYTSPSPRD